MESTEIVQFADDTDIGRGVIWVNESTDVVQFADDTAIGRGVIWVNDHKSSQNDMAKEIQRRQCIKKIG